MSIRRRMTLSFAALLALFGINLAIYLWGSSQRQESFASLEQTLDRLDLAEAIERLLDEERREANLVMNVFFDPAAKPLATEDIDKIAVRLETIQGQVDQLAALASDESGPAIELLSGRFEHLLAALLDFYNSLGYPASTLNEEGLDDPPTDGIDEAVLTEADGAAESPKNGELLPDEDPFQALLEPPKPPDEMARLALDSLAGIVAEENERAERAKEAFARTDRDVFRLTTACYVLTAAFALLIALWLSAYLSRGLKQLKQGARRIGSGELAYRIPVQGHDELAELATAFNEMSSRLLLAHSKVEQARRSAESANRAKSSFLASMSHELRTPMNAIIGYSEMLIEDAEDVGDESSQRDLEKILAASRHLLGLINDVLDLSKVEAGKMTLELETFALEPLLTEVADTIRPAVEKNENRFELEGLDSAGTVTGDSTKLRQILLNLLGNAAKFTRQGRVVLTVERLSTANGERLRLAVIDTGIGMTQEQVGRIFDQFTQAELDTARHYGGTGLGLAISREFCRLMGGDIGVDSTQGVGTTFTVDLPTEGVELVQES